MTQQPKPPPLIVWWIIWAALLSGVFVIYTILGNSMDPEPAVRPDSAVWMVGFIPFVFSSIVRWLVLPRLQNAQTAFPLFVVGLALAEATCIIGVFVFPLHKLELFLLGVLGLLQFIPYFAAGYYSRGGGR